MKLNPGSTKQLNQNQTTLVLLMLAVVVWVVGIIISKAVFDTIVFNNKVIGQKRKVESTLRDNIKKVGEIKSNYDSLVASGFDPQLATRALPTKLDVPGLASKLEALLAASGVTFDNFALSSDSTAQVSAPEQSGDSAPATGSDGSGVATTTGTPTVHEFSFTIKINGSYGALVTTLRNFESQLSPMRISALLIEGTEQSATANITVTGYYQDPVLIEFPKETIQ